MSKVKTRRQRRPAPKAVNKFAQDELISITVFHGRQMLPYVLPFAASLHVDQLPLCLLCDATIGPGHQHPGALAVLMTEPGERTLGMFCTCPACADRADLVAAVRGAVMKQLPSTIEVVPAANWHTEGGRA